MEYKNEGNTYTYKIDYSYKAVMSKYKSWDQLMAEKRRKSRHWKAMGTS